MPSCPGALFRFCEKTTLWISALDSGGMLSGFKFPMMKAALSAIVLEALLRAVGGLGKKCIERVFKISISDEITPLDVRKEEIGDR